MPMSIVPVQQPTEAERFFDAGGSTFHVHTCATPKGVHQWRCNSPYCQNMNRDCPDHGGKEPISIGEEPWRK